MSTLYPYELRVGDGNPSLSVVLEDSEGAVNLTNMTVRVEIKINGSPEAVLVKDCTISSASGGVVQIDWDDGDISEAGSYQCLFIATNLLGAERTFPSRDYFQFVVFAR